MHSMAIPGGHLYASQPCARYQGCATLVQGSSNARPGPSSLDGLGSAMAAQAEQPGGSAGAAEAPAAAAAWLGPPTRQAVGRTYFAAFAGGAGEEYLLGEQGGRERGERRRLGAGMAPPKPPP